MCESVTCCDAPDDAALDACRALGKALAMGSGDMEVFATPAMVALMEHAAMHAVAADLPEGSTTVGASMETTHVRPSSPRRRNSWRRRDAGSPSG